MDLLDIDVRYPGAEEPVLHGVELTAQPGQTIALIGPTGAGKTTLLDLVPRLLDPTRGAVLVGGVDVRELAPAKLAATVGYVPQQAYLFSGTIASNLRYGDPTDSDAQLWHAQEIAQARELVETLPGRLEAPIGQGGRNVSGGQSQRLCIARTLVARPQVYLFDDRFSALDHATDAALRAALADTVADAAVVTVAQRVSTIRDADRIIVLDHGDIVGTGVRTPTCSQQPHISGDRRFPTRRGGNRVSAGSDTTAGETVQLRRSRLRLLRELRADRALVVATIVVGAVTVGATTLVPLLLGRVTDLSVRGVSGAGDDFGEVAARY